VPAPLRETIEARSQQKSLVLAPAEHASCLVGYDLTHFERLESRLAREFDGDFGPGRGDRSRILFGTTETLRYDETGRIVLSPILKELGGIDRQALFLGAGDYFEIWSPEVLLAEPGLDARLKRIVSALVAGRTA
jgi:MraZ protein